MSLQVGSVHLRIVPPEVQLLQLELFQRNHVVFAHKEANHSIERRIDFVTDLDWVCHNCDRIRLEIDLASAVSD